jgi:hypothetical protein
VLLQYGPVQPQGTVHFAPLVPPPLSRAVSEACRGVYPVTTRDSISCHLMRLYTKGCEGRIPHWPFLLGISASMFFGESTAVSPKKVHKLDPSSEATDVWRVMRSRGYICVPMLSPDIPRQRAGTPHPLLAWSRKAKLWCVRGYEQALSRAPIQLCAGDRSGSGPSPFKPPLVPCVSPVLLMTTQAQEIDQYGVHSETRVDYGLAWATLIFALLMFYLTLMNRRNWVRRYLTVQCVSVPVHTQHVVFYRNMFPQGDTYMHVIYRLNCGASCS